MNETKQENFVRLGTARTVKALNDIRLIGNLATGNYDYTPAQAASIIEALTGAVASLETKFSGVKERPSFSLPTPVVGVTE